LTSATVLFASCFLGLLLFAFLSVGIQTVEAQTAVAQSHSADLTIISPSNTTYSSNSLLVNVTISRLFKPSEYDSTILYSLNGEANVTVPSTATYHPLGTSFFESLMSFTTIAGAASLPQLSEGYYCLTVYGIYTRAEGVGSNYPAVMHDIEKVYFTVDDGVAPSLANLQIQNRTYEQKSLPLNFTVDEQFSWMGYSLDGEANVTFTGNITLSGLVFGSHNLVIYANDTVGNMAASEKIYFAITEPFSIIPVAAVSVLIAAAVASALLVYFRRNCYFCR